MSIFASLSILTNRLRPRLPSLFEPGALAGDAVRLAFGTLVSQAIMLVATPFILRFAGPQAFGLFAIVGSAAAIATVLATLRLEGTIAVQTGIVAAARLTAGVFCLATVGSIFQLVLLLALGDWLNGSTKLAGDQRWLVLAVPLMGWSASLNLTSRAWMVRLGRFSAASFGQMARAFVFVIGAISCSIMVQDSPRQTAMSLAMAQVAGDFACFAIAIHQTPSRARKLFWPPPFLRIVEEFVSNRRFLGAASLSFLASSVTQALPVFTVGLAFGTEAAGWLSAAQRLIMAPVQLVINSIGSVLAQRGGQMRARGQSIAGKVGKILLTLTVVGSPCAALAWLYMPIIVPSAFGLAWIESISTFRAVMAIGFFAMIYAASESLPLLFRLSRFLIVSQLTRLAGTAALMLTAVVTQMSYQIWLLLFVSLESLYYTVYALYSIVAVISRERKARCAVARI